jgi:hypothetical protein
MIPMIPLAILALTGAAAGVQMKRSKDKANPALQAQYRAIYETAIGAVDPNSACKDPVRLRKLADAFEGKGLAQEADMLRKRATLRELPEDVKKARKDALRKLLACTDPAKVLVGADAFESQGCTGAAMRLREYASGLSIATVSQEESP